VTRGIIFDGDDTLWATEHLYDEARQRARRIVEASGLDGSRWEELERRIDVENVERLGHSVDRFPASCVEAYEALCSVEEREADPAVREAVKAAARTVFERRVSLLPYAREVLAEARSRGFRLALLTKGDATLQRRRLEQSGLAPFFDLVQIVDRKTPEAITGTLERLGVEPASALSVGNSIRSDVLPSLAAGVRPVWIEAHVWEYERAPDDFVDDRVIQLEDLSGLIDVASHELP
jgi:putative hydrolase of the HAD superfamily